MLVSAAFSSANERSPLVVCSSLTRLETVTSSVIAPTSMREGRHRDAVVGVDDDVGLLEGLEALERRLQRVGVGPDDVEDEASVSIGDGGERIALGAAGERDRHAWQHAALLVLHGTRDRGARGLRLAVHCQPQDHETREHGAREPLQPSVEGHGTSLHRKTAMHV